jgi:replicative DNA helicase
MNDELFIERAFLGSILSGAEIPVDVTAGIFSSARHRTIFKALQELKPQCSPDIRILAQHLAKTGELDAAGGPAYIAELTSIVPGPSNIQYYAETLIENSKSRKTENAIRLAAENIKRGGQGHWGYFTGLNTDPVGKRETNAA